MGPMRLRVGASGGRRHQLGSTMRRSTTDTIPQAAHTLVGRTNAYSQQVLRVRAVGSAKRPAVGGEQRAADKARAPRRAHQAASTTGQGSRSSCHTAHRLTSSPTGNDTTGMAPVPNTAVAAVVSNPLTTMRQVSPHQIACTAGQRLSAKSSLMWSGKGAAAGATTASTRWLPSCRLPKAGAGRACPLSNVGSVAGAQGSRCVGYRCAGKCGADRPDLCGRDARMSGPRGNATAGGPRQPPSNTGSSRTAGISPEMRQRLVGSDAPLRPRVRRAFIARRPPPEHLPPTIRSTHAHAPIAAPSVSLRAASRVPESTRDPPFAELSPGPSSAAPLLHPQFRCCTRSSSAS